MTLRPLHPPVKQPLMPGWEIMATEAGRTGRGLKATLHILNGEPKGCQSIALGYAPEQNQFAEAVYHLCGVDEATVKALLPKLAYAIEDILRKMADIYGNDEEHLPGQPFRFEDIPPWDDPGMARPCSTRSPRHMVASPCYLLVRLKRWRSGRYIPTPLTPSTSRHTSVCVRPSWAAARRG